MSIIEMNDIQTDQISVSATALEKVRALIEERELEGHALRVYVSGGGCSGMQYGMGLDAETQDTDHRFEFDGIQVIVDPMSMGYLGGATIDYIDDMMGGGFKIENPNAVAACGCGSSFRTKDSAEQSAHSGVTAAGSCCG